jgi:hypothetical protein
MKCIANRPCQKRVNGKAVYFYAGDMHDFEECPSGFTPIEKSKIVKIAGGAVLDFGDLKDDVVRALDFDIKDLKRYMSKKHPMVTYPGNIGREKLVEKYLYARAADDERGSVMASTGTQVIDPVQAAADAANSTIESDVDDSSELSALFDSEE